MRYQSTVFGQLLKEVPRGWFERVATEHHRGRKKRCLSPWAHLVTIVFVQLAGTRSLRDVERTLERHPGALAHLGLATLRRSTLADANAARPAALFEVVATKLSAGLGRRGRTREALRLIDATRIFAGRRVEQWSGSGGIKLHVTFDPAQERPICFAVTPERVNDITVAQTMPIEPGATYVFDKGFYDFAFWARLAAAGCRFVTRLKKNSPTLLLHERPVADDGILFDRCVRLSERLSGQRRNPFQHAVRLIGVRIASGREIVLLTNDLEAPAAQIAALYKARWQIELFFKWIKQNLKIAHFLGSSRNAATIQIMAALIAYLLLRLAQLRHAATLALQAIARLLPATIFSRRSLTDIVRPPDKLPSVPALQAQLPFGHA
jgi:transposase